MFAVGDVIPVPPSAFGPEFTSCKVTQVLKNDIVVYFAQDESTVKLKMTMAKSWMGENSAKPKPKPKARGASKAVTPPGDTPPTTDAPSVESSQDATQKVAPLSAPLSATRPKRAAADATVAKICASLKAEAAKPDPEPESRAPAKKAKGTAKNDGTEAQHAIEISKKRAEMKELAKQYIAWDTNAETRAAIQALLDADDDAALEKALGSRLEFGTAGLRGPMAAGYTAMNELTVVQTTQGLAVYLEQTFGADAAHAGGVAIGWDHRAAGSLNSEKFGLLAAEVLLRRGFRVALLPGLVHTPMVSFCVARKGCKAGIMVTASHNPKADDGYKVYWDNGAQIIPPHDAGIASGIEESLEPWASYGAYATADALLDAFGTLATACTEELRPLYYEHFTSELCRYPTENATSAPVVYTAMHGVGAPWFAKGFDAFNLPPPIPVAPDPNFPTVAFPNPEEGAGALQLAFETAAAHGATLVLANDPDADRLAVAEQGPDGTWSVLSGNQIGVLLADWQLSQHKLRCAAAPGVGSKPTAMLSSAVSSRMISALCAEAGCLWEETLTGFKWLCARGVELRAAGYEVLMSYEEAIGFNLGSTVNDKDGVSAGAVFAEMAGYLARVHGRSVTQQLEHLYARVGRYTMNSSYVICRNPATTTRIFERLRADGKYWLLLGAHKIEWVRDLTTGVDTDRDDGRATLPLSKSSHMITYRLANGATFTLRGSGTEPKIKWYAEMVGADREATTAALQQLVELIVAEMLQPKLNGLEMRN